MQDLPSNDRSKASPEGPRGRAKRVLLHMVVTPLLLALMAGVLFGIWKVATRWAVADRLGERLGLGFVAVLLIALEGLIAYALIRFMLWALAGLTGTTRRK